MQGGTRPNAAHPITVEPVTDTIIVRIGDVILAESDNALILREASLAPVYYIPADEVALDELSASTTRTHCPYKGDASYFSTRDGSVKDVAWSYQDPFDHMLTIKGHLAFYPDRVDAIEAVPGN
ncbi:hypothetical protein GCM10007276_35160 [Agaricicola taiwanensis]|uniref:DUF427 domain-containing protein n=1 Tax=Agaricicola taiwanensis TaxID=591372 RepID=A0A8J2YNW6_9RHOB|nr:DUF427 domain-containing protein [Agaricicola taiwanensis]GGE55139.1 hypothetical protein GCM10007276_35160 [Agaricicola taiwanensis]